MSISSATDERPRVLVVDDEKFIRDLLADFLKLEGYFVRTAEDGAVALEELTNAPFDLVISDLKMPRMGGIELLDAVGRIAPSTLTIIMTGFGTVETALDAMKRGAFDYVLKPFKVQDVVRVVQRGLEKQRLAAENLRLREAVSLYTVSEAIAASLSLDQVLAAIGDTAINELKADFVSTWLDDGNGGYVEEQRLVSPFVVDGLARVATEQASTPSLAGVIAAGSLEGAAARLETGTFSPQAFLDHYSEHAGLLEHVLGITPEAQAAKTNLWYPQDARESLGAVRAGRGQVLFLMRGTPVADVRAVAEAGEVMPQKSTFFFPKVLTGLAIHTLDPTRTVALG